MRVLVGGTPRFFGAILFGMVFMSMLSPTILYAGGLLDIGLTFIGVICLPIISVVVTFMVNFNERGAVPKLLTFMAFPPAVSLFIVMIM